MRFRAVEHRALCIVPFFRGPARPRVFAHRGGCALGPENTIAAFDRGLAAGADGLELDVHLSADGVVVVCHDETLDRTTDGIGTGLDRGPRPSCRGSTPAIAIPMMPAGIRFGGSGVSVPTLREVLRALPGRPDHRRDEAGHGGDGPGRGGRGRRRAAPWIVSAPPATDPAASPLLARRCPDMASSASRWKSAWRSYRSWARWPVRAGRRTADIRCRRHAGIAPRRLAHASSVTRTSRPRGAGLDGRRGG